MLDFRFARFAVVGLANTLVGLSVIFACKSWFGLGDLASNALGYSVAVPLGFALNKSWTFEHKGGVANTFSRYVLVLAVAYLANLATTLLAIDVLHLNSYLSHVIGIGPYAVMGYVGGRLFAFRTSVA